MFLFLMNFLFSLEYVQFQNYQSMLHFQHSHIMLSNEFLLVHTNQYLLYMSHPLF